LVFSWKEQHQLDIWNKINKKEKKVGRKETGEFCSHNKPLRCCELHYNNGFIFFQQTKRTTHNSKEIQFGAVANCCLLLPLPPYEPYFYENIQKSSWPKLHLPLINGRRKPIGNCLQMMADLIVNCHHPNGFVD
jgi:hypothetical protein